MKVEELAAAIQRAMVSREARHAAALVGAAFDHLCSVRVAELVRAEALAEAAADVIAGTGPERLAERHVSAAVATERKRVEDSGETLAAWFPEDVVEAASARLTRASGLPSGWWEGAVDAEAVRRLVAGALADTVEHIVGKLPFGGGMLGGLGRGGGRGRRGGGLLGAIGGGFVDGMKQQIRDLALQSVGVLRERLEARMQTDEGRQLVDQIRRRAVGRVLELPVASLHGAADDPGPEEVVRWARETMRHNAGRPELRAELVPHIEAALERETERTVGELLDDAQARESTRRYVLDVGTDVLLGFAATEGYGEWLRAVLVDALAEGD